MKTEVTRTEMGDHERRQSEKVADPTEVSHP